jgi:hypothetical protein
VRGLADRGVVHAEIASHRPHHHVAGVDADADLHLHAVGPPQDLAVRADLLLHAERRVAGAHGVILVGEGGAEERHDPVSHHLVDGALVAMDGLHHPLHDGVEDLARLLGVPVGEQLGRALEVGEEHRHMLALALYRGLRGEDALGEMLRRVGLGRAEAGPIGRRGERGAALAAELLPRRVLGAAARAPPGEARAALAAELLRGGIAVPALEAGRGRIHGGG